MRDIIQTIKIGVVLGLLLVLSAGQAAAVAGGPTLELISYGDVFDVGDEFPIQVDLNTKLFDVSAVELHLTFPANLIEVVSLDASSFLPTELVAGQWDADSANITVGSGVNPKNGIGPIAVLTVRALAEGSPTISIDNATQIAAAGEAGDVKDTLTGVNLTIGSEMAADDSDDEAMSDDYQPICTPANRTISAGQEVSFSVSNADGSDHSWTTTGGTTTGGCSAGVGHRCLNVRFDASGTYNVRVTSLESGLSSTCQVTVAEDTGSTDDSPGTTTVSSQAAQVQTGPMAVMLIALISAAIAAVAYVGYTSTDRFRRGEAGDIIAHSGTERDRGDFKS